VTGPAAELPGVHVNFLLVLLAAIIDHDDRRHDHRPADPAPARGLHRDRHPRLREIIGRVAINGDALSLGDWKLTNGRQGITRSTRSTSRSWTASRPWT
jgi:hypothetical protein